jgi:hypothetical protein
LQARRHADPPTPRPLWLRLRRAVLFDKDREVKQASAIGLQESLDLLSAIWLLTQVRGDKKRDRSIRGK